MNSAVVCLSGGLDSSVSLLWAKKEFDQVTALFFNYGQKALSPERKAAQYFSKQAGVDFLEVDLGFLGELSGSALNSKDAKIPVGDSVDITSDVTSQETANAVWVPNRNGLFINVAAVVAESKEYKNIVVGFNLEEAETFPDNSVGFVAGVNASLGLSTKNQVQVVSPTIDLNKVEIVHLGKGLGLEIDKVWPCYKAEEKICGECESCKRFVRAVKESEAQ